MLFVIIFIHLFKIYIYGYILGVAKLVIKVITIVSTAEDLSLSHWIHVVEERINSFQVSSDYGA